MIKGNADDKFQLKRENILKFLDFLANLQEAAATKLHLNHQLNRCRHRIHRRRTVTAQTIM